jgi:hypothetical protein
VRESGSFGRRPEHQIATRMRAVRSLDQGEVPRARDPVGERHLRRTIAEFVAHYHRERNQDVRNELIQPLGRAEGQGRVRAGSGLVAC